jgi:hypothetical protein
MQDRGRDDLIDDVQNGRMSREAAEEEAARLGLPPLARVPDQIPTTQWSKHGGRW